MLGHFDKESDPGEISHFRALCSALSATVGLGNIAGVAVAIHVGGPGATFWMILVGFLGMVTKYVECTLSISYRRVDQTGEVHGGPMHYIAIGLGERYKPMAAFYAVCLMLGGFGAVAMFQSNQVAQSFQNNFGVHTGITGAILCVLTAVVIAGGIKRIGAVAGRLVPVMASIYIGGCVLVLLMNATEIPAMLSLIASSAFSGVAAGGGMAGIAVREVLVQGARRACFSNEAGLGTAAIAHSAARTSEAAREGAVAMLGPLIDTVIICTMTSLVIISSGLWRGGLTGIDG